ncbi:hypothetical protein HK101_009008 [Irineochytrium annulatum]|nr:hypothetical protein HK101_009008 [Irineochytrium annulatum]
MAGTKAFFGTLITLSIISALTMPALLLPGIGQLNVYNNTIVNLYVNCFKWYGTCDIDNPPNGTLPQTWIPSEAYELALAANLEYNRTHLVNFATSTVTATITAASINPAATVTGPPYNLRDISPGHWQNATATPFSLTYALFPVGYSGILFAMPYHLFDYAGLETIPMLAEESANYLRDGPRAIALVAITYAVQYWGYALLLVGLPPGVWQNFLTLNYNGDLLPLATQLGVDVNGPVFTWVAVVAEYMPCITSSLACAFSYTRLCYMFSRTGYLPAILSKTTALPLKSSSQPFPWVACISGFLLVTGQCLINYLAIVFKLEVGGVDIDITGTMVQSAGVFVCFGYLVTGLAYLWLRLRFFVVVTLINIGVMLSHAEYKLPLIFAVVKIAVGLLILFILRKRLRLTDEEIFIRDNIKSDGRQVHPNDGFWASDISVPTTALDIDDGAGDKD